MSKKWTLSVIVFIKELKELIVLCRPSIEYPVSGSNLISRKGPTTGRYKTHRYSSNLLHLVHSLFVYESRGELGYRRHVRFGRDRSKSRKLRQCLIFIVIDDTAYAAQLRPVSEPWSQDTPEGSQAVLQVPVLRLREVQPHPATPEGDGAADGVASGPGPRRGPHRLR